MTSIDSVLANEIWDICGYGVNYESGEIIYQ